MSKAIATKKNITLLITRTIFSNSQQLPLCRKYNSEVSFFLYLKISHQPLLLAEYNRKSSAKGSPTGSVVKNMPVNAKDLKGTGSIPGLGRFPGGSHGTHSRILAWRSTDRGAWQVTVHRVTKIWTRLKQLNMHACMRHPLKDPGNCSFRPVDLAVQGSMCRAERQQLKKQTKKALRYGNYIIRITY